MNKYAARKLRIVAALIGPVCTAISSGALADAEDDPLLIMGLFDQLESRDVGSNSDFAWDGQGWIGRDLHKFWFKTDGEREGGSTDNAELQFLYSRAIAPYWDVQVGVRQDFLPSPSRTWTAIGVQGLAPYFFETNIAFFIGDSGRTALRFESEYELLITQRLILTPDIEINFYGKDDAATGIGSGLSDLELGLRLRYEIRREFAPYIGVNWSKAFGKTADLAQSAGEDNSDAQLVIGFRTWF